MRFVKGGGRAYWQHVRRAAPTSTAPLTAKQRLDAHLCLDLYVASRAIIGLYRPLLAPHGLTYPQYLVLLALWEHGAHSVKALGARLSLDAGTLSPLLKRLEAAGYLVRERQARDGRALQVALTPAGAQLQGALAGVPHEITCATGLDAAQVRALQATLRDLTARLAVREPPTP